jgi:DNA glycosylase AlkZ-like
MTRSDIAQHRLKSQHIFQARFEKPEEVVAWLGAVQAQDYNAAKWALGLRLKNATDETVERAFTTGSILRTHLLRPTWHLVVPADIRWMLALTAPRVHAASAYQYRKLELDAKVFRRTRAALAKALEGGRQLTRDELRGVLAREGIAALGLERMAHIMMAAELDGLVCSGGRRGKQFTYALLEERVPKSSTLGRDEALAELVKRFFVSHGPATLQDFVKWSGLTAVDAKRGLEIVKAGLSQEIVDRRAYWFSTMRPSAKMKTFAATKTPVAFLLPNYDEFTVGYRNEGGAFEAPSPQMTYNPLVVVNGRIVGTWRRALKKNVVVITLSIFARLGKAETQSLAAAARQYGTFLNLAVVLA